MNRIASRRPETGEYSFDYHQGLIEQVRGDCVLAVLESQLTWLRETTTC